MSTLELLATLEKRVKLRKRPKAIAKLCTTCGLVSKDNLGDTCLNCFKRWIESLPNDWYDAQGNWIEPLQRVE